MAFCTQCGRKVEMGTSFCTGCGTKVERKQAVVPQAPRNVENRFSRLKEKELLKNKNVRLIGFSVLGALVLIIGTYFVVTALNKSEMAGGYAESMEDEGFDGSVDDTWNEEEGSSDVVTPEEIMARAKQRLDATYIVDGSREIGLGEWKVNHRDGTLAVSAIKIPEKDLQSIFSLYDEGDVEPLEAWAKEVYSVVAGTAEYLGLSWDIEVGNDCSAQYPKTLATEDIISYSGSCGYSIPLLSGSSKSDLALVINDRVFASASADSPEDYILPYSAEEKLTRADIAGLSVAELRLARNEIYARHGYVFKSEDLQKYFSEKSWYEPDPSYNGVLNDIEKYNVDVISAEEEAFN